MKTVLCIVVIRIFSIEGRVFCQDLQASIWMPLGFSCPLNCGNIVTAVRRLKTIDYKKMFNKQVGNFGNTSTRETAKETLIKTNDIFNRPVRRNYNFIPSSSYKNINKILEDKQLITSIKIAINMAANGNDTKCPPEIQGGNIKKLSNCRRMYDHEEFLKKFTNLLNKYTHSKYQFTEELSSIILEKILGTNLDLRHGLFDIKRILTYLSKAMRYHKTHTKQDFVIRLKSTHCLSVSVPGCYCRTGFVESSGQCVQPSDCIGKYDTEYLARIIVQ